MLLSLVVLQASPALLVFGLKPHDTHLPAKLVAAWLCFVGNAIGFFYCLLVVLSSHDHSERVHNELIVAGLVALICLPLIDYFDRRLKNPPKP